MGPRNPRIAVLEADTPLGSIEEKHGTYGDIFETLLNTALKTIESPWEGLEVSKWDVVTKMEYPELDDVDAVLITGSRHNAFDSHPWILKLISFTQTILSYPRARLIGVCYGHQIIGRALGSTVTRSEGGAWEVSVCNVQLTPLGKSLFHPNPPEKDNSNNNNDDDDNNLSIMQMHRDILTSYPQGVEPLGSSPRCLNQGMYIAKKMISVQGHPEFTEDIVRRLLESRKELGVFDGEVYRDAVERVGDRQDGVKVAAGFLRFLMDGLSEV